MDDHMKTGHDSGPSALSDGSSTLDGGFLDTSHDPIGLSGALFARYQSSGDTAYLDDAVQTVRDAIVLNTFDFGLIMRLSFLLLQRYDRFGRIDDNEENISLLRRALNDTTRTQLDKLSVLNNLGSVIFKRFERTGDMKNLGEAISMYRRAAELTPDDHPNKLARLNNLGCALESRFGRVGELGDLEAAIASQRRAVELTPDGHPAKPTRLNNLGNSLESRFGRVGELGDLEAAIASHRRAVELTPDGHPDRPMWLSNLGSSLQSRFGRVGELGDLEAAIASQRRAVELTPDGHPDKPARSNNLGNSLESRFGRVGELGDLEAAIASMRRAVELTPDGHPDKPALLNNLGCALESRFGHVGELGDLEAAIASQRRAVDLAPDGHPDKPRWLNNLGISLESRFELDPTQSRFSAAHKCFVEAFSQLSGSPDTRFGSARRCVGILTKHPRFSTRTSILQAHSNVLRVLPELVWLGHSMDRRYEESFRLAGYVYTAVSTAIECTQLKQAVEWLETGRSLIWSQLLALRTPLDELQLHHPELSNVFSELQRQLQTSANILRSDNSTDPRDSKDLVTIGFVADTALDRHRTLSIEYDRILSKIRDCKGFADFLRPKQISSLLPSYELGDGYFVYLNVHTSRCDALVLTPGGDITTVTLPDLSAYRASRLSSLWTRRLRECGARLRGVITTFDSRNNETYLGRLLGFMWKWIVHPVLLSVGLTNIADKGRLPHITWCPTGPLAQLPLHAAGIYSEPCGPRLYTHAVSSYASSLSALLRCSSGLGPQRPDPNVLVVTQPATPGQSQLPGTMDESTRLQQVLDESHIQSEILNDKSATVAAVRTVMDRYPWVHLACHGSQHPSQPTQSAFHLYDGPLSLSDLMQTVSDNAELAFLSACQTATGDEKNPEESVHLAAGMLAVGFKGVIATMWSIGDADAPIVVEAYYEKLLELRRTGAVGRGETGAAYALHEATKVLRDRVGERNFLSWAPFVHFGA